MEKIFNLIFLALILQQVMASSELNQLEIECKFERVGWDDIIGPAYTCNVLNLNVTEPKQVIKRLKGTHPVGETNDKVNTVLIFEQVCEVLPLGIDKFFRNVEGLAIQRSSLKKITKNDLKPFGKLKSISLFGNKLKYLESNLFMYNPQLRMISVFNNQLVHIFSNIFDGLKHLQRVYFSTNDCINEDGLNVERIEILKCKLAEVCKVTEEQIEKVALDDENERLKENLQAVSKSFVITKRRLEKTERTLSTVVESTFKDTLSAATYKVELDKCEAEKFDLLELIQELEVVEIVCKESDELTCIADGLKVLKSQIRLVNVKREGKVNIIRDKVISLVIDRQQTLFLPLNMSFFLPNIKKLTITQSELLTIDGEIFKGFDQLLELNLSNNKLTEVKADQFSFLMKLEKLDLSHNLIDSIQPDAFYSLKNLVDLMLNDNLLLKLNNKYFDLNKNLRSLTLNNNQLVEIASSLLDICGKHLEMVDFTNNECIDAKFPKVSVEEIKQNIQENCTVQIDFNCKFVWEGTDYVCQGQNVLIESRNIRVNSISGEHKPNLSLDNVTALEIVNQSMIFFPSNFGSFVPNLNRLKVDNSKLIEVRKETFVGLENLSQIIIKHNYLKTISDESFINCLQLQVIDLSFNNITKLVGNTFANFSTLNTLNLSHNQLSTIDRHMLSSTNKLKKFIISQNKLASIDPEIIKLLRLANLIDIEGNKCIDSKFDYSKDNEKKVMELFGEVSFKCQ